MSFGASLTMRKENLFQNVLVLVLVNVPSDSRSWDCVTCKGTGIVVVGLSGHCLLWPGRCCPSSEGPPRQPPQDHMVLPAAKGSVLCKQMLESATMGEKVFNFLKMGVLGLKKKKKATCTHHPTTCDSFCFWLVTFCPLPILHTSTVLILLCVPFCVHFPFACLSITYISSYI